MHFNLLETIDGTIKVDNDWIFNEYRRRAGTWRSAKFTAADGAKSLRAGVRKKSNCADCSFIIGLKEGLLATYFSNWFDVHNTLLMKRTKNTSL